MAVGDEIWWSVWWPWMLVWHITVVSLVIAIAITFTHWRRHRSRTEARRPGISFYLDDESVMDLYRQYGGKYKAALRHEVQERIVNNSEFEGSTTFTLLRARGKQGVNRDVFRSYIEEASPITVIGTAIDVLDEAGDIIDVDLIKREVVANRAFDKAIGPDEECPATVRLRGLKTFVSIYGEFQATDDGTSEVTTFEAPYGDPASPVAGARVRVGCVTSGLRRTDIPNGSFPAYCVGRVENWDPSTRNLTLRPIAIFN